MTFSKGEAINFGWETTKKNLWYFVGVFLIIGLVTYIPGVIAGSLGQSGEEAGSLVALINVATWIVGMILQLGLIHISLLFVDDKKPDFAALFAKRDAMLVVRFIVASILYGLMVAVGLLLLVVPGVYLAIKYMFFRYFLVDKNAGIIESLKMSAQATQGVKWELFAFVLILIGINILGVLAFVIGLFVTMPLTSLAGAYVYRKLAK